MLRRIEMIDQMCIRDSLKAGHEANIEAPEELAAVLQRFYDNIESI